MQPLKKGSGFQLYKAECSILTALVSDGGRGRQISEQAAVPPRQGTAARTRDRTCWLTKAETSSGLLGFATWEAETPIRARE